MGISDLIAGFINEMLDDEDGFAEVQRAQLANRFNCVPSQINYVISTRFSPERGYIVESRRGGNGYIRIRRVHTDFEQLLMHTVNIIGEELDMNSAAAFVSNLTAGGIIEPKTQRLILSAIGENALRPVPPELRAATRANILKHILINIG